MKKCRQCGSLFVPGRKNRRRQYCCSRRCIHKFIGRRTYRRNKVAIIQRHREKNWGRPIWDRQRLCQQCAQPFRARLKIQKHCSAKCRLKWWRQKQMPPAYTGSGFKLTVRKVPRFFSVRACVHCGNSFQPLTGNHHYCTKRCLNNARSKRDRDELLDRYIYRRIARLTGLKQKDTPPEVAALMRSILQLKRAAKKVINDQHDHHSR